MEISCCYVSLTSLVKDLRQTQSQQTKNILTRKSSTSHQQQERNVNKVLRNVTGGFIITYCA
jgi:hypothetical protein